MSDAPSDWQLRCKEMKHRGAHLLQTGQWSDCLFLVGSESNEEVISCHKLLLAMASPVFDAMLYGVISEKNNEIKVPDVQPDIFRALLQYIYTDSTNITSFDMSCELCYAAKKYMLPQLVMLCYEYLWRNLSPKNACKGYEFGKLLDDTDLMDECIQVISVNTKAVVEDSSFEDIDISTLVRVFSLDYMKIDSEMTLFNSLVKYTKARSGEDGPGSEIENTNETVPSNVATTVNKNNNTVPELKWARSSEISASSAEVVEHTCYDAEEDPTNELTVREALGKIRFLTVTPQQFADGPARSSLLTPDDNLKVLINMVSSNPHLPMPSDFSLCRYPREKLNLNTSMEPSRLMSCVRDTLDGDFVSYVHFQVDHDINMFGFQMTRSQEYCDIDFEDYVQAELVAPNGRVYRKLLTYYDRDQNDLLDFVFHGPVFIGRNKEYKLKVSLQCESSLLTAHTHARRVAYDGLTFDFRSKHLDYITSILFTL